MILETPHKFVDPWFNPLRYREVSNLIVIYYRDPRAVDTPTNEKTFADTARELEAQGFDAFADL